MKRNVLRPPSRRQRRRTPEVRAAALFRRPRCSAWPARAFRLPSARNARPAATSVPICGTSTSPARRRASPWACTVRWPVWAMTCALVLPSPYSTTPPTPACAFDSLCTTPGVRPGEQHPDASGVQPADDVRRPAVGTVHPASRSTAAWAPSSASGAPPIRSARTGRARTACRQTRTPSAATRPCAKKPAWSRWSSRRC